MRPGRFRDTVGAHSVLNLNLSYMLAFLPIYVSSPLTPYFVRFCSDTNDNEARMAFAKERCVYHFAGAGVWGPALFPGDLEELAAAPSADL